jgi:hypothetical protein
MRHTDRRFTQDDKALLRRAKGTRLLSVDAVLVAPDRAWNAVRLHFDGFDLDLRVHPVDISYDESGPVDEYGLMSVEKADPQVLAVPEIGDDAVAYAVDKLVESVYVVDDLGEVYEDGGLLARVEYPQAAAFRTDAGYIVFDNGSWFSELIDIGLYKATIEEAIYDESQSWEAEPGVDVTTHWEFRSEMYEL